MMPSHRVLQRSAVCLQRSSLLRRLYSVPAKKDEEEFPMAESSAYAAKEAALNEQVYVKAPRSLIATPLEPKYRLGHFPIYTAPSSSYVSLTKRLSLGGAVFGTYVGHLIYTSESFGTELGILVGILSILPVPIVQYFTRPYVTRIFRLYDKEQVPQTYENLTQNETLVFEKIGFGGKRLYRELAKVKDLKLVDTWYKTKLWQQVDSEGFKRRYYVSDDIGGIKMERVWGIVEKNSGVDNGRGDL